MAKKRKNPLVSKFRGTKIKKIKLRTHRPIVEIKRQEEEPIKQLFFNRELIKTKNGI